MEKHKKTRCHVALTWVYASLGIILIAMATYHVLAGEWEMLLKLFLLSLVFYLPYISATVFHLELTQTLKIGGVIFVFCACILGEAYEFYLRYPLWDDLLHFFSGLLFCAFACALIEGKRQLLFSFCFSVAVSTVWEFFEFFADLLFGTNMQKDIIYRGIQDIGLIDTMADLLAGAVGALFFAVWYSLERENGLHRAEKLIPIKMIKEPKN